MATLKPLLFFDHDPASLAARLGVSLETARRYYYQRGNMPAPMRRLARILLVGDLGAIDAAWHGHRIRGDTLILPNGDTFTPGQLMAYQLRLQLLADYERQLREQKTRRGSTAGFSDTGTG